MRYLITSKTGNFQTFLTEFYSEDMFDDDMIVCDLSNQLYTYNGIDWYGIIEDHL